MKTFAGIAIALGVLAVSGEAAAQTMIVSAQGPSAATYRGGTLLKPGATLDLKAGDHVTIFQGGGTRRFDGPGRFSPQQPSPEATTALISLIDQKRPVGASRIGAVRGFGGSSAAATADAPTGLWQINVTQPGTFCIAPGQSAQLWRGGGAASKTVITRVSDNVSTEVTWRDDARLADWPAELPTADGETYLISNTPGGDGGVTWRSIPAPTGDWTAFAGALAGAGCNAQLDTLRSALATR